MTTIEKAQPPLPPIDAAKQLFTTSANWRGKDISNITKDDIQPLFDQVATVKKNIQNLSKMEKTPEVINQLVLSEIALAHALETVKEIEKKVLILDENSWNITKKLKKLFHRKKAFVEVSNPTLPSWWSSPSAKVDKFCRLKLELMFQKNLPPILSTLRHSLTSQLGKDGLEQIATWIFSQNPTPDATKDRIDLLVLEAKNRTALKKNQQHLERLAQPFLLKETKTEADVKKFWGFPESGEVTALKPDKKVIVTLKNESPEYYFVYSATAEKREFHRITATKDGFVVAIKEGEFWKEQESLDSKKLEALLNPKKVFCLSDYLRYLNPRKTSS